MQSQDEVLIALRRAQYRQVVRYRHEAVFLRLHAWGLIEWVRQPPRISHWSAPPKYADLKVMELAVLTPPGRQALETLEDRARSDDWCVSRHAAYVVADQSSSRLRPHAIHGSRSIGTN